MAKLKAPLEKAAAKILERRNKTEAEWKKDVLEKAQLSFLRGEDKELEDYVLNRERQAMIVKEITK